ncbi:response regulator [Azospirillum griseum]|nr:response regulator [Azospirillum griseum]
MTVTKPTPVSRSRSHRLLLIALVLIVALGVALRVYHTWTDHEDTLRHAEERVQNAARVVQEHLRRTVATGDLALVRIIEQIGRYGLEGLPGNRPMWQSMSQMVDNLPEISAAWVYAPDGRTLLTTRGFPAPAFNASDRGFFPLHANGTEFQVGERIVGPITGQDSFVITRRVPDKGPLQAVVQANVDLDYYQQLFDSLELGAGATIAVFRTDGKPVLRVPAAEALVGEDVREALRRAIYSASETFEIAAPTSGGTRIVSFQRVTNLPLIVLVGVSKAAEMAVWEERAVRGGLFLALAVFCCAGLAFAAARSLTREDAGQRRLADANTDLDRTANRLAEANRAFANANRRMNLILHSASDSICGVDRNGIVTFANPAASVLTGYSNEELLGRNLHALIHHTRADGTPYPFMECPVMAVLQTGEIRRGLEDTYWTKDGNAVAVEYTASPMLEDGRVEGAVLVFHEIAERKRAEAAMTSARVAAETANRAKTEFLANMSHEIRTPMNAILGLTHLLQQTALSDRQADYLRKVRVSAQSLLGILNDILDFSKVEAGRIELESVDFRLDDLLQNLGVIIGAAAQDKDIEVLFSVAPDVPLSLIGDPLRLQQVLINLAGNAIKFTDRGEVVVAVKRRADTDDGVILSFSVRDSGIGISAEQKERLFQAFSQGDASTTRRFGGTGLGLAICARLVGLMGGRMDVDSVVGRGSDFHFEARFGVRREALPSRTVARSVPRDLSVLVVDDHPTARAVLAEIAGTFGWAATACANGREALDEIERATRSGHPYDLVLMDWKMPEMDGLEAARRVRADDPTGAPIIIVISGYGRERVGTQFEEIGVAGFLVKPVTASTLLDAVTVAYARQEGRGEGSAPSADRAVGATADTATTVTEAAEWSARRVLRGRRLLLAEDNGISRDVAREILERAGARVETAEDGRHALALLRNNPQGFDAVLMDVHMPDMNGFEATAAMRSFPGGDRLPIIAMTASALPADRQRCLDHGMSDHVPKPFDIEQLFTVLTRWIGPPLRAEPGPGWDAAPPPARPGRPSLAASPSPSPAPNPDALPDALPGLDVVDALSRFDGDVALLRRFVESFAKTYSGAVEEIAAALERGDLPRAKALGHELKSLAGNIGARTLSAAADAVQIAAHVGSADGVAAQIPTMRVEMAAVLDSARRLERAGAAAVPPPSAVSSSDDVARLERELAQFVRLLQDSNFAAAEEFAILAPLLTPVVESSAMKSLTAAIDSLDFPRALGIVQRIARELGVSLPTV